MRIEIPYGKSKVTAEIPDENILAIAKAKDLPAVSSPEEEIKRAVMNPINSPPLTKLAKFKNNAVIVVDDYTRPTVYTNRFTVPVILNELNKAGLSDKDVSILVATGMHAPPNDKQLEEIIGKEILERVKVTSHDPKDKDNLTYIGNTSKGNKVWINKKVVKADLKIATGLIEPHCFAGYSGGRKSILPGVTGEETTTFNHSVEWISNPNCTFMNLKGNIAHEDMMEAAQLAKLDFILNVVLNTKKELVKAVAGDMIDAWNEGVKIVDAICKVEVPTQTDVLITGIGGYPKDRNFFMALNSAEATYKTVKKGGSIIIVAECKEGVGYELYDWFEGTSSPDDILKRIETEGLKMSGGEEAFWMAKFLIKDYHIYLASEIPDHQVETMFMEPASSVEDALNRISKRTKKLGKILISLYSPPTIPVVTS